MFVSHCFVTRPVFNFLNTAPIIMTIEEIKRLLANGEGQSVAVIPEGEWHLLARTVCAMANSGGGNIVVGASKWPHPIEDDYHYQVAGVPSHSDAYSHIRDLDNQLTPLINTTVQHCEVSAGYVAYVVSVGMPEGGKQAVLKSGESWVRVAGKNKPSPTKGIGEAEIGKNFIVAHEDPKVDRVRISKAILANEGTSYDTKELSETTGIALKRVNGICERLFKDGKLSGHQNTSSGSYIQVTEGDRIVLDELVRAYEADAKVYIDNAVNQSPSIQRETVEDSAAVERITESLDLTDSLTAERTQIKVSQLGGKYNFQREAGEGQACLSVDEYAIALAKFFESTGNDPTNDLCFGLFGHWGRGKTYLMRKVSDLLEERNYSIVNFSAWKYRSTPETWAYLFKQVMSKGAKYDWRLPARAAILKYEAWPLISVIYLLAFSLLMRFIAKDLLWLIELFGIGLVVYVVITTVKFWNAGVAIKTKYLLTGHDSKLGLQASIGDDLRAVMKAWIPSKDYAYLKTGRFWSQAIAYVIGTLLCSAVMLRATTEFWFAGVYLGAFLVLSIGVPILLFCPFREFKTKRMLLIVDDLDRCEIQQMLEVIESTMLLLDDREIKKRVQIVMLVEERAVRTALEQKYKHLWQRKEPNNEDTPEQILRENMEKIFLAHLRLPELTAPELKEVIGSYIGMVESPEKAGEDNNRGSQADSVAKDETRMDSSDPTQQVEETSVHQQDRIFDIQTELVWSDHEKEVFSKIVPKLKAAAYSGRWGPRAIRSLMFRYQMARSILSSLKQYPKPEELVDALLKTTKDNGRDKHNEEGLSQIEIVADQVS